MKFAKIWPFLCLCLAAVVLLLSVSPAIQTVPPRDSGIFLYVGSRLLKGDALYRDVWDHKPPVIFLINALGLWLAAGSRWGVWALELISLLAVVGMAFSSLRKSFGMLAGVLGILSGFTILFLTLHGGNYTEQFGITFQFASLFFLARAEGKPHIWNELACGMALGFLFLLRQNLVGVGAAIGLFLVIQAVFKHSWQPVKQAVFIGLGFVIVCGACFLYFLVRGTFNDFWDAAFYYNQIYSALGLLERVKALKDTLAFFPQIPLLLVSFPIWLLACVLLFLHISPQIVKILKNHWTGWGLLAAGLLGIVASLGAELLPGSRPGFGLAQKASLIGGLVLFLLAILQLSGILPKISLPGLEKNKYRLPDQSIVLTAVATLWYPIEIFMIGVSGRDYLHYYMAICAVCILLYAFLFDTIQRWFSLTRMKSVNAAIAAVCLVGIGLNLVYNPFNSLQGMYTPREDNEFLKAARYVEANTSPKDKVLVWGLDPVINFLSGRGSPIRYAHIEPFFVKDYGGEARSAELLGDLVAHPPALIIHTGEALVSYTADGQCTLPSDPLLPGMDTVMQYICDHYIPAGTIDSTGFDVYKLK